MTDDIKIDLKKKEERNSLKSMHILKIKKKKNFLTSFLC